MFARLDDYCQPLATEEAATVLMHRILNTERQMRVETDSRERLRMLARLETLEEVLGELLTEEGYEKAMDAIGMRLTLDETLDRVHRVARR